MLNLFRSQMQAHPRSRFATAAGSRHFIPWQEPGLVAAEIVRMVPTTRQSSANRTRTTTTTGGRQSSSRRSGARSGFITGTWQDALPKQFDR
jgi:hypothetical protein